MEVLMGREIQCGAAGPSVAEWSPSFSQLALTRESQAHISQDTEGHERGLKCCICCQCISRCWHPLGTGITRLFTGRPAPVLGWTSHYVLVPVFYIYSCWHRYPGSVYLLVHCLLSYWCLLSYRKPPTKLQQSVRSLRAWLSNLRITIDLTNRTCGPIFA